MVVWWNFHVFDDSIFWFFGCQKNAKNHIFKKMQFCNIFLPISSILLIFCYFSCFLSPKSLSFIKILILGRRLEAQIKTANSNLAEKSSLVTSLQKQVQERDSNITFVSNFSCGSVWNREFLMKIGSRWTQNYENGILWKFMIFFIFSCI